MSIPESHNASQTRTFESWQCAKIFISIKYISCYYQVFLVAGGSSGYGSSSVLSSTETLVEGSQAWNFQKPLPTKRYALRGISLPNTVILTGKQDKRSH